MIIDCEGCTARPAACADCVVTFVLESPARRQDRALELDDAEQVALGVLADGGLVPPLRMVADG